MTLDLARFYGKDQLDDWRAVIGPELHYHFGHFNHPDDDFQKALRAAIRQFYPAVPHGSSVLDLGAGWGGPARLLQEERQCRVTCVTNTPEQAEYLRSREAANVLLHDLETGLPENGDWEVAWMMESLEHIRAKEPLIAALRQRTGTLIIRTSATRQAEMEESPAFGGSMYMTTQQALVGMLARNGWQIVSLCDSRKASWPTLMHWKANIAKHFGSEVPAGNFRALDALCDLGISRKDWWIWSSPLLNVVCR